MNKLISLLIITPVKQLSVLYLHGLDCSNTELKRVKGIFFDILESTHTHALLPRVRVDEENDTSLLLVYLIKSYSQQAVK